MEGQAVDQQINHSNLKVYRYKSNIGLLTGKGLEAVIPRLARLENNYNHKNIIIIIKNNNNYFIKPLDKCLTEIFISF